MNEKKNYQFGGISKYVCFLLFVIAHFAIRFDYVNGLTLNCIAQFLREVVESFSSDSLDLLIQKTLYQLRAKEGRDLSVNVCWYLLDIENFEQAFLDLFY